MPLLTGPFVAVMLLLFAAGVLKTLSPATTANALRSMRLPSRAWMVRVLGVTEIAVAGWSVAAGGRLALASAAMLYLAFAIFVVVALRNRLPVQSCGCFGRNDTPPSTAHVAVDLIAALVILSMAATHPAPVGPALLDQTQIPVLAATATIAYLGYVLLAIFPATMAEVGRRR